MKKFKGTNGEWKVGKILHQDKSGDGIRYYVFAEVLEVNSRSRGDRFIYNQFLRKDADKNLHNESYYNAKIISQAPNLLENLIRLVDRMEENGLGKMPCVTKAKAIIKKSI